eukprot:8503698-Pyramimonas_sp.AAC.1
MSSAKARGVAQTGASKLDKRRSSGSMHNANKAPDSGHPCLMPWDPVVAQRRERGAEVQEEQPRVRHATIASAFKNVRLKAEQVVEHRPLAHEARLGA